MKKNNEKKNIERIDIKKIQTGYHGSRPAGTVINYGSKAGLCRSVYAGQFMPVSGCRLATGVGGGMTMEPG